MSNSKQNPAVHGGSIKLLNNTILVEYVPVKYSGRIAIPDQFQMRPEDGSAQLYRLVDKANPEFEAEPGDNLLIRYIASGPEKVGENRYVIKNPDEHVLAVIPRAAAV